MTQQYKPMLAHSAETPFTSKEWIFEIKWDGIRAISYINEELSIKSRNGKELKHNFPELEELKALTKNVVLDGEIVIMKEGKADFQTLIERSNTASTLDIMRMAKQFPATYIVFDLLEKDGEPMIDLPLIQRKQLLKESMKEGKYVTLSLFADEQGEAYYEAAVKSGVEGVIAKKKDSPYAVGVRSHNWLKIKKLLSCDCVIFGYTVGEGARAETFGALILGLYDQRQPVYVGKVGTGFSEKDLGLLKKEFKDLEVNAKTVEGVDVPEKLVWLKPDLVCEVIYQSVTSDRKLRMPRFHGLRADKTPFECTTDQLKLGNLREYSSKRDFAATPEPKPADGNVRQKKSEAGTFVVQEHHARRLHYDLRLEHEGVLKSWAVPKGVPEQEGEKRLAVGTEDHPLTYGGFEGTIPKGQYGAGEVKIWDRGIYDLKLWEDDKIEFSLKGERLHGRYVLVRFKRAGKNQWVLLKAKD